MRQMAFREQSGARVQPSSTAEGSGLRVSVTKLWGLEPIKTKAERTAWRDREEMASHIDEGLSDPTRKLCVLKHSQKYGRWHSRLLQIHSELTLDAL